MFRVGTRKMFVTCEVAIEHLCIDISFTTFKTKLDIYIKLARLTFKTSRYKNISQILP